MTVSELTARLATMPQGLEVVLWVDGNTYGITNAAVETSGPNPETDKVAILVAE